VNNEALDVFLPVKDEIMARLIEQDGDLGQDGGDAMNLTLISFKTQCVVGTNYFLKVIGRIKQRLSHTPPE